MPIKQVIADGPHKPVKVWTHEIEPSAQLQLRQLARLINYTSDRAFHQPLEHCVMKSKSVLTTLASALAVAALITACGGGQATSAADTSQLQSEITTLQSQVAQLQTEVAALGAAPAVFIKAPNAPTVKVAEQMRTASQKATTTSSCTGLGTLTGRPSNSDPIASNLISGVSCAGYYYTLNGAATSADTSTVQPLEASLPVWFDSPGCAGNAYVTVGAGSQSLSVGALANGAVFTVNGTYWMLKPGTASAQPNLLSEFVNGNCINNSVSQLVVYPLAPNDQTVSGVPNAPIQGPVTIG